MSKWTLCWRVLILRSCRSWVESLSGCLPLPPSLTSRSSSPSKSSTCPRMMRTYSGDLMTYIHDVELSPLQRYWHHLRGGADPQRSHSQVCLCHPMEDQRTSPTSCLQVSFLSSLDRFWNQKYFSPKIKLDTENMSGKDSDIPEWKLQPKLSYDDDEDN